jgi:hypothetical protein
VLACPESIFISVIFSISVITNLPHAWYYIWWLVWLRVVGGCICETPDVPKSGGFTTPYQMNPSQKQLFPQSSLEKG